MDDAKIERILAKFKGDASLLIQALLEIQKETQWLSRELLEKTSLEFNVPLSKVEHLATFHKSLNIVPEGRHKVHICNGTSCHLRGSSRILETIEETIGTRPGETDGGQQFSLEAVTCLGRCGAGPIISVDGKHHSRVTPDKAADILKGCD